MSAESASDNVPRLVTLFEAFLKLEHLRGRSADEVSADVQAAVYYLAERHLRDKLSSLDSLAAGHFASYVNQAIAEEVTETLNRK